MYALSHRSKLNTFALIDKLFDKVSNKPNMISNISKYVIICQILYFVFIFSFVTIYQIFANNEKFKNLKIWTFPQISTWYLSKWHPICKNLPRMLHGFAKLKGTFSSNYLFTKSTRFYSPDIPRSSMKAGYIKQLAVRRPVATTKPLNPTLPTFSKFTLRVVACRCQASRLCTPQTSHWRYALQDVQSWLQKEHEKPTNLQDVEVEANRLGTTTTGRTNKQNGQVTTANHKINCWLSRLYFRSASCFVSFPSQQLCPGDSAASATLCCAQWFAYSSSMRAPPCGLRASVHLCLGLQSLPHLQ